jgi:hypothetical protein
VRVELIISVKRSKPGSYRVDVYSKYGQPLTSYSDVKTIYLDEKSLVDLDELYVEAILIKYVKEKAEVRVYTKIS